MILKNCDIYEIFEDGKIQNKKTKRILKGHISACGYRTVKINKKSCLLHRLLAIQFIPNPNNYTIVDHIDRNKLNNNLQNLRWVSRSINNQNRNAYKKSIYQERYITRDKAKNHIYYEIKMPFQNFRKKYNVKKFTLDEVKIIRDEVLKKYDKL